MKKKIFAFALAAAALIASVPTASAQCDRSRGPKTECKADGNAQQADKMYRPQKFTDFAFEGVLLTVDQQAQVDAVNAEFKARREQAKVERQQARKDRRAQCDSTACNASEKQCAKACKDGKRPGDFRKEYVQKMKAILTPEQYTTFLENIVFMPQPQKEMRQGDRKGHHGDRKCDKGPRAGKAKDGVKGGVAKEAKAGKAAKAEKADKKK